MVLELYRDVHQRLGGTLEELACGSIKQPSPNEGHLALARLEQSKKNVTVVTQNIDGLHQKAGNTQVIELHGTESTCTCMKCGDVIQRESVLNQIIKEKAFTHKSSSFVPRHQDKNCGGVLKADVVLFGEPLPTGALWKAAKSVIASSVVIVVGSSLEVAPANMIPGIVKKRPFGKLIVINLDDSGKSIADIFLKGKASEVLPQIVENLNS